MLPLFLSTPPKQKPSTQPFRRRVEIAGFSDDDDDDMADKNAPLFTCMWKVRLIFPTTFDGISSDLNF